MKRFKTNVRVLHAIDILIDETSFPENILAAFGHKNIESLISDAVLRYCRDKYKTQSIDIGTKIRFDINYNIDDRIFIVNDESFNP